ncbi:chemotaxis response regulator protein-glutamate methylesterase [Novosphingobium terrae]|uniref:chemotaxis response regulator protein-glutamate methylesterase n=1 Tax=Novosphingobium terrae TaxID=2726189 RepID=UPI00197CD022|nr:chemotaxis response regulator protein-glutamate methylesterase [Novosphingobium terrae]
MRIAIVNDLPMAVEAMRRALSASPHQIVWTAGDGAEAVDLCARDRPDLILMDLTMPRMNGVEATRRIMAQNPCAILIVTAGVEDNAAHVFAAMGQGAIDAVDTPLLDAGGKGEGARALLAKIDTIARLVEEGEAPRVLPASRGAAAGGLLAIGASAGGPAALAAVLGRLPRDFPAATVIVQHVDARFAQGLAEWLDQHCALPVRLAAEGDSLRPGTVLVAGTDDHLVFKSRDRLGYTSQPADHTYRPSIDVFFASAGRWWNGTLVAALLTGMGADGARGLKDLRAMGHHTIAQDQASSAVYGMPKAAAALGAATQILPLERIAPRLIELLSAGRGHQGFHA